jgi:ABC-type transport system involved in multi-copper enzyme maturation permease subunit
MNVADPQPTAAAAGADGGGAGVDPRDRRRMRVTQAAAVFRLELRRILRAPGTVGLLALAGLPAVPFAILWIAKVIGHKPRVLTDATRDVASVFQAFIVPMVIFFGCVVVFTSLVRRDQRERTLHHYLLAPVRREILLAGKYAAGVVASFAVFGGGVLAAFTLAYVPFLADDSFGLRRFFLDGPGFGHLASYLAVTLLACLGYGAVFLALGLVVRNPIIPALSVFGWETIHGLLPPLLKKLSVFHYLHALCPVPVAAGPFALLAEDPSAWVAVPSLLLLAAVLVALSLVRFRRVEIQYGEE